MGNRRNRTRRKKSILPRVILLLIAFAAGFGVVFWLRNGGGRPVTRYTVMEEATLPVVSFYWGEEEINTLHGYRQKMDQAYMLETMLPVDSTRQIQFKVSSYGQKIHSLSYELRATLDGHLLEKGEAAFADGEVSVLRLGDLMDAGAEYYLLMTAETERAGSVNYYTRLYYDTEETCLTPMLAMARDFSRRTFDKTQRSFIGSYLETDASYTGDSLAHVTIKSSRDLVTWADLAPWQVTEPAVSVQRVGKNQVSLTLSYDVEAVGENGNDRYRVQEFFCLRDIYNNTYLMSYDRQMEQVFVPETAVSKTAVSVGISSRPSLAALSAGTFTVFEAEGDLWEYDVETGNMIRLFSFKDADDDGVRTLYNHHGYRVIQVDEEGNTAFLVYGYMNRGSEEGHCGLAFYRFEREENTLRELFFVESDRPYEILEEEARQLFCVGSDGLAYLIYRGTLYGINVEDGEPVEIATHGRHDPCVGLRAAPIAEAMLALVLMDHALRHRAQNADVRVHTPNIERR